MSRSIFGWSYPPGCSGPPEDVEPVVLRCQHCKGFLGKPIRHEPWEASTQCNGKVDEEGLAMCGYAGKDHEPHKEVWDAGVHDIYHCKKCGKETKL